MSSLSDLDQSLTLPQFPPMERDQELTTMPSITEEVCECAIYILLYVITAERYVLEYYDIHTCAYIAGNPNLNLRDYVVCIK